MNPFELPWLPKAVLSLAFVIPAWLALGFFEKNFAVRGEVQLVWYFLAAALGSALLITFTSPTTKLIPSLNLVCVFLIIGFSLSTGANALLFSAMPDAPNPGIPQAIQGSSVVFVFFISWILGKYIPYYFKPVTLDPYQFFGIFLSIVGITIVIVRAR